MSKNKNYLKELNEIKSFTNKIRKINLNENICFEDEFEDEMEPTENDVPVEDEEPVEKTTVEDKGLEELDANGTLDTIREITLKGMTKLCKTPEDPEFQALLKIFQICNKGAEPKEEKQ